MNALPLTTVRWMAKTLIITAITGGLTAAVGNVIQRVTAEKISNAMDVSVHFESYPLPYFDPVLTKPLNVAIDRKFTYSTYSESDGVKFIRKKKSAASDLFDAGNSYSSVTTILENLFLLDRHDDEFEIIKMWLLWCRESTSDAGNSQEYYERINIVANRIIWHIEEYYLGSIGRLLKLRQFGRASKMSMMGYRISQEINYPLSPHHDAKLLQRINRMVLLHVILERPHINYMYEHDTSRLYNALINDFDLASRGTLTAEFKDKQLDLVRQYWLSIYDNRSGDRVAAYKRAKAITKGRPTVLVSNLATFMQIRCLFWLADAVKNAENNAALDLALTNFRKINPSISTKSQAIAYFLAETERLSQGLSIKNYKNDIPFYVNAIGLQPVRVSPITNSEDIAPNFGDYRNGNN